MEPPCAVSSTFPLEGEAVVKGAAVFHRKHVPLLRAVPFVFARNMSSHLHHLISARDPPHQDLLQSLCKYPDSRFVCSWFIRQPFVCSFSFVFGVLGLLLRAHERSLLLFLSLVRSSRVLACKHGMHQGSGQTTNHGTQGTCAALSSASADAA